MKTKTGDIRIDKIMPYLNPIWKTVNFEDTLDKTPTVSKIKLTNVSEIGLLPVIDQGENFVAGYIDNIDYAYSGELPVIIFGDHTRRFKLIDFSFCIGADGCKLLKPKPFLDIEFFYNYLWSLNITSNGYSRHYKFLKEIKVPVPELSEQRRIVARLKELLSGLNSARNRLDKIPAILRRFRQSVLSAACSGRLTAEWREGKDLPEWENVLLENILKELRIGPFGTLLHASDYIENGIPIVNPKNLTSQKIVPDYTKSISIETLNRLSSYKLEKDDIVIARRGEMGRTACVTENEHGWLCGTGSMIIRLMQGNNSFLYSRILSSQQTIMYLEMNCKGTTMKNLNENLVKKIPIPKIPLSEQEQIVCNVDALFALADNIEQRYNTAKVTLARAEKAVYKKAFGGEL